MSFLPEGDRYAFSLGRRVTTHDCDVMGRLRLSAALRFVESISTGHLEAMSLGYQRLYDEGMVFVLAAQAIRVHKLPVAGDALLLKTCPAAYQGAQMVRETVILSSEGEILLEVQAAWVMINPRTRAPLRPTSFKYPLPMLADWQPFRNPAKLRLTTAETPVMERVVRFSHLDINRHMNNTVYADLVMDALPLEEAMRRQPATLLLRLRREARAGECLGIKRDAIPGGYAVCGQIDGQSCFEAEIIFAEAGGQGDA